MLGGDLIFLHCGKYPHCAAAVDKHFEGYVSLQLMTRGSVELFYDQRRHELRGSWLWVCWPGPRIRFHLLPGHTCWHHRYAAFTGTLLQRWMAMGVLPFQPQRMPSPDYPRRFDALLALIRQQDRWSQWRAANALEAMLLELAQHQQHDQTPWLAAVQEKIEQQNTLWPDYRRLARELGMAASTLRRKFHGATGVSLHHWVLQQRLSAARQLLGESHMPIKQVASQLAYRDVFYFTRQFRRLMGITPAAYRRSRQQP